MMRKAESICHQIHAQLTRKVRLDAELLCMASNLLQPHGSREEKKREE
jgi:hypothetical protein